MSVTTLVKSIQDIMRKDTGVDGDAQRISQMVWMMFMKIFDDREKEWELMDPGYKSPIASRFRWRSWASNPEGMTGDELIDFINNDLFQSLKSLATKAGNDKRAQVVGSMPIRLKQVRPFPSTPLRFCKSLAPTVPPPERRF